LTVRGLGAAAKYQETVLSMISPTQWLHKLGELRHPPVKDILTGFTGTVKSGEMLCTHIPSPKMTHADIFVPSGFGIPRKWLLYLPQGARKPATGVP
jgi:hypothetical protein